MYRFDNRPRYEPPPQPAPQPQPLEAYPAMVVVFGAEGCPACESYLPVFRGVAERHPIPAFAVDCNQYPKEADRFRVTVTPTTILFFFGRQAQRLEGERQPEDIERLFRYAEGRL